MKKVVVIGKWILRALVALFLFIAGMKAHGRLGLVNNKITKFDRVPGSSTKIVTVDQKGAPVIMDVPKDPETGRQYNAEDVRAVGISKGGEIEVEIKHDVYDRRSRITGNG